MAARPHSCSNICWLLLRRYLLALYWSMTTLATVGYGDFTGVVVCFACPSTGAYLDALIFISAHCILDTTLCCAAKNVPETIWATFFMFLSVALSAFIIGSFTLIVIRYITMLCVLSVTGRHVSGSLGPSCIYAVTGCGCHDAGAMSGLASTGTSAATCGNTASRIASPRWLLKLLYCPLAQVQGAGLHRRACNLCAEQAKSIQSGAHCCTGATAQHAVTPQAALRDGGSQR